MAAEMLVVVPSEAADRCGSCGTRLRADAEQAAIDSWLDQHGSKPEDRLEGVVMDLMGAADEVMELLRDSPGHYSLICPVHRKDCKPLICCVCALLVVRRWSKR